MNRFLTIFNLLGVAALLTLCAFQWRTDRRLSDEIIRQDKEHQAQIDKIDEQDRTIKAYADDEKQLSDRLAKITSDLNGARQQIADRDAKLDQANSVIQQLIEDRDDAIAKFNDLANKYNVLVKEMNTRR